MPLLLRHRTRRLYPLLPQATAVGLLWPACVAGRPPARLVQPDLPPQLLLRAPSERFARLHSSCFLHAQPDSSHLQPSTAATTPIPTPRSARRWHHFATAAARVVRAWSARRQPFLLQWPSFRGPARQPCRPVFAARCSADAIPPARSC